MSPCCLHMPSCAELCCTERVRRPVNRRQGGSTANECSRLGRCSPAEAKFGFSLKPRKQEVIAIAQVLSSQLPSRRFLARHCQLAVGMLRSSDDCSTKHCVAWFLLSLFLPWVLLCVGMQAYVQAWLEAHPEAAEEEPAKAEEEPGKAEEAPAAAPEPQAAAAEPEAAAKPEAEAPETAEAAEPQPE